MTLRVVLGLGLVFAQVLAQSASSAVGAEPIEVLPSSLVGGEIPFRTFVRTASASEVSILARDTQISTYGLTGLRDSRVEMSSAAPLEQAQELGIPANSRIQVVETGRGEDGLDYTLILINDEMLAWVATSDLAQVESLERTQVAGLSFITPVRGRITSRVGMRFHPVLRRRVYHAGTDYAAPIGAPVKAAADGVVSFSGHAGAYGIMIQINHAGGIFTRYAHLSRSHVSVGQRVTQGTLIGRVGNTGRSTGPHLHYERRRN
jgi:murein DD-endopeptidase MepM/ murein hydrolase activator NlpD